MKRSCLLIAFAVTAILSCKKTSTTTNNTIGVVGEPEFLINGLTDVTLQNDVTFYSLMPLTVQYQDSVQETVSLSLSGLPAGVIMDSSWVWSGLPTYSTTLTVLDTTAIGAKPGTYPLTLTAATASGSKKSYSFNLYIQAMPSNFLGKYANCSFPCASAPGPYSDSLYADPAIPNKIWFSNFGNWGGGIYGLITVNSLFTTYLKIPLQTIGGSTYSGTGQINLKTHAFGIIMQQDSVISCTLSMH